MLIDILMEVSCLLSWPGVEGDGGERSGGGDEEKRGVKT